MSLLYIRDTWFNFLQHLVLEDFVSPLDMMELSKTCKNLYQWVHESFKAYYLIYAAHLCNSILVFNSKNFYRNDVERRLFQKFYKLHKNKPNFLTASIHGIIPILDYYLCCEAVEYNFIALDFIRDNPIECFEWWINSGLELKYTTMLVDLCAKNNDIQTLRYIFDYSLKNPTFELRYSEAALTEATSAGVLDTFLEYHSKGIPFKKPILIDFAAFYGNNHIIKWWIESAQKYPDIITFTYTPKAVDYASNNGKTKTLTYLKTIAQEHPNLFKFTYTSAAIDEINPKEFFKVFNWWLNSGYELKYTKKTIRLIYNINQSIDDVILFHDKVELWLQHSKFQSNFELKVINEHIKKLYKNLMKS